MIRAKQAVAGICLVVVLAGLVEGRQKFWVESRLFQASREEVISGPAVIVSSAGLYQSFMRQTIDPEWSENLTDTVMNEASAIYKYPHIEQLAKLDIAWDGAAQALDQTVVMDAKACRIRLAPRLISKAEVRLRVEVSQRDGRGFADFGGQANEGGEAAAVRIGGAPGLLDTELVLKVDEPVVLGFPADGRSYFLLVAIKTTKRDAWRVSGGVARPYREANLLPPPAPVERVDPEYPERLKEQKVEGRVVLEVSTDKMGRVTNVQVVESAHPELDRSALEALKRWRFESALLSGRAVPVTFQVTVEFKARDQSIF